MGPSTAATPGAARRLGALVLVCLLLLAACGTSPDERRTAAARDPQQAVERALEQARSDRPAPATEASPPAGGRDASAPASARGAVRGRDDLTITEAPEPVPLDDRRVLTRLPVGLSRSDAWETTVSSPSGDLDVAVVAFDADDAGDGVGLDVRLVDGEPRAVAEERQRDLAGRSAVTETSVRGREAVVYATGPATRTLRWIDRDGTLIVLEGMGLSSAALEEIGRSVRPASRGVRSAES